MFVKPGMRRDDPSRPLAVRLCHARTRFLSPLGEEVPETIDWHRALLRGDVVLAEAPKIEEAPVAPVKPATTGEVHTP